MKSLLSMLVPKKGTYYLENGTTLRNAIEKFKVHKFSVIPLIDKEGKFIRTISEGDLLRFITSFANYDVKASEMVLIDEIESYRPYQALNINASLIEVLALSLEQNFIPLVDDRGLYIGIVKRKEILEYLIENRQQD